MGTICAKPHQKKGGKKPTYHSSQTQRKVHPISDTEITKVYRFDPKPIG